MTGLFYYERGGSMTRKTGSVNTAKKPIAKKVCSACGKEKSLSRDFFVSYNMLHKDGRIPMCKDCIRSACNDENGEFDIENFKSLLRQLDKPFIQSLWNKAILEVKKNTGLSYAPGDAIVGKYIKNISMQQHRSKTWKDSNFSGSLNSENGIETARRKSMNFDKVYYLSDEDFIVTEDIIRLFGEGYTSKEYETMQRIYEDSKQDYPNISSNQRNLLLRYVRFAAKEEIATSSGGIADAEKWSKLASEALKQLNSIDIQGGISCFSEFFQRFEREQDIARILPQFKYRPNDAPDFIIWCYINYCRRLEGKSEVEYSDVYKFYDEKVNEYLKQYGDPYGIFTDDTRLDNRKKIEEFIELPQGYYGDGD